MLPVKNVTRLADTGVSINRTAAKQCICHLLPDMWWMRQLVSSLAPESSTAAWRVCFTLNYTGTGWTSLNESSINCESWSTGAYKAWRHSTWSIVAFVHQTLPVVNVSDLPLAISWSYHVIVVVGSDVGHSPWQAKAYEPGGWGAAAPRVGQNDFFSGKIDSALLKNRPVRLWYWSPPACLWELY